MPKETKTEKKSSVKTKSKEVAEKKVVETVKKYAKKDVKIEKDGSFAVIETGGKQYKVSVGDSIKIEKLKDKEYKQGDIVSFNKVLLIDNGKDITNIGTPYIEGAKVFGIISEIGKNKKIIVMKYKQKSRYLKKNGHRQPYFKVLIDKIS